MPRIYKEHTGGLPYRQSRLRVIIADDHTILRQGLRAILEADSDLEVIGEASNVQDALALARCLRPDVVITDVSFENGSGIRTLGQLRRECVGVRVIMLTGHDSEECERAAMKAGAHAYILKDSPIEVLLRAVHSASSEGIDAAAPAPGLQSRRSTEPPKAAIAEMTARERQVLIGVALGYSSKRIAGHLGRSVKTIEKHRFKMMHKLGLHNAAAVTRYAIDNGLLVDRNGLLEDRGEAQESRLENRSS
ncbi:MAG: hypothetical protein QOD56_2751 [Gammaproteobacteria bacterium]|jgi:DNA-binding NarL/FixJ family response regulator|nr:hypothetical protein [Gammaproteobacteria bacterium]